MSTQANRYISVEEYLELEDRALDRHEYLNGEVFAMAGGTLEHSAITTNVIVSLGSQLAGADCIVRGSDAHIRTSASGLYSYADIVVSCGREQSEKNVLLNPVLIVEVLSKTTGSYDRGVKFEMYREIPSFSEYLIIAQDRVYVEHHVKEDAARWTMQMFTKGKDEIKLKAVSATLRLADVYAKVLPV